MCSSDLVSKPLEDEEIELFQKNLAEVGISSEHILPHDSYLINLGHPDEEGINKSREAFLDEVKRCEQLGLKLLNFHPGSHLNRISIKECIDRISESINMTIERSQNVVMVIENTAGQGSNVGYEFSQLRDIIDGVEDKSRVGVCLDTCHLFASGYDIRTKEAYEKSMAEFGSIVGFEYLKGMHINDAKVKLGSKVDRHHSLGCGEIGIDAFRFIVNDFRIGEIPLILETIDDGIWDREIEMLYGMVES